MQLQYPETGRADEEEDGRPDEVGEEVVLPGGAVHGDEESQDAGHVPHEAEEGHQRHEGQHDEDEESAAQLRPETHGNVIY